jgi:hypothetical protein
MPGFVLKVGMRNAIWRNNNGSMKKKKIVLSTLMAYLFGCYVGYVVRVLPVLVKVPFSLTSWNDTLILKTNLF